MYDTLIGEGSPLVPVPTRLYTLVPCTNSVLSLATFYPVWMVKFDLWKPLKNEKFK